jgi:hypothetical protein
VSPRVGFGRFGEEEILIVFIPALINNLVDNTNKFTSIKLNTFK